ncbi:hypothetical protein [Cohnella mopanensis]|uniref:hypothetical protein n=1 Tax=Cohnella mopanensis TaxID=2911966 RepID=UPI001EF95F18|nr:hypothetical protein [Cohnella mopanensis]
MAIIPLKQKVVITKPGADTGWGHAVPDVEITLKARVVEETRIVKNAVGDEAVSSMSAIFGGLPNVAYDDILTFTNELGVIISRKPLSIEPRRGIGGKTLLTEVYV